MRENFRAHFEIAWPACLCNQGNQPFLSDSTLIDRRSYSSPVEHSQGFVSAYRVRFQEAHQALVSSVLDSPIVQALKWMSDSKYFTQSAQRLERGMRKCRTNTNISSAGYCGKPTHCSSWCTICSAVSKFSIQHPFVTSLAGLSALSDGNSSRAYFTAASQSFLSQVRRTVVSR